MVKPSLKKGRPKKTGFKGTPKKPEVSVLTNRQNKRTKDSLHQVNLKESMKVLEPNCEKGSSVPKGLQNQGENVCFFNSVVQMLYSLPEFRHEILSHGSSDETIIAFKNLMAEISNSNKAVKTSHYLQQIRLHDYVSGMQYDAHECLIQILEKIYPNFDDCIFTVSCLESVQCTGSQDGTIAGCMNEPRRIVNNMDLTLELNDSLDQNISSLILQSQTSRAPLGYRCDNCGQEDTCDKVDLITGLSDILIINLKIFSYDHVTNRMTKKVPNLSINSELKDIWGQWTLHAVIYHEGLHINSGHYTCGIKVNDNWFMISDTRVVKGPPQLSCKKGDWRVPYIVVYRKKNEAVDNNGKSNDINCYGHSQNQSSSVHGNNRKSKSEESEVSKMKGTVKTNTETKSSKADFYCKARIADPFMKSFGPKSGANKDFVTSCSSENLMRMDLLKELNQQKERVSHTENIQTSDTSTNLILTKSIFKRKRKFSQQTSTKSVKKFRAGLKDETRKAINNKHKQNQRANVDNETRKASYKKEKQGQRANLNDETRKAMNNKHKQDQRANLDEKTRKAAYKKEKQDQRANLDEKTRKAAYKKEKQDQRANMQEVKSKIFANVQRRSMVDTSILETQAYKLIKESFFSEIKKGPDYVCDICHKCEYLENVLKLNSARYEVQLFERCHTEKSEWVCKSCDKSMRKNKMPAQAYENGLGHCSKIQELDILCPLELTLISQIIPFMFIVGKAKGAQHGLKGQCVLVPADLSKVQKTLPRTCNDDHIITLALKRRLTDKSAFHKQHIRPALVNKALNKLKEINPLYDNIVVEESWANISEQNDPELWNLLTGENIFSDQDNEVIDSDEEIEGNEHCKENQQRLSNPHPTVMHNVDGPNIDLNEIVNIAPGEGQIPVYHSNEPDCEALAFPSLFSTGKFHYNYDREVALSPSKYIHTRLKNCDKRYAENPQYIFYCLDWLEKEIVNSTKQFVQRKQYQSDISAGQLMNADHVRNMISEDQIYASFKNVRGTPQYYHNMMLDVLAKIRQYGTYTFFLTCSAAEFHWPEVIQACARQYQEHLTDDDVNNMDWHTKVTYLKRDPVTAAEQINYIFKKLYNCVILSKMHPIGQIINYDDRREYQNRGTEHMHVPMHVLDAPTINEDDDSNDSKVVSFIDKYITCLLPDEATNPDLHQLVQQVQTHHHTTTCRRKKGVTCRFGAPWPPSEKTLIIRGGNDIQKHVVQKSKEVFNRVLLQIAQMGMENINNVTTKELLALCDISEAQYEKAIENMQKKLSVIYKRKPCEVNVGPYNTVILSLLRANMNLQYVTGVYAMIMYLTSYLCKPEHTMSELMKKAAKEAQGQGSLKQLNAIGNVFLTKREVSTHEAIKRLISLHMRSSNVKVDYIPTGHRKNRTRILKSQEVLEKMDPDDTNVYATNVFDRYMNRPDELNEMCYADFAANYITEKADINYETDDVRSYTSRVQDLQEHLEPERKEIIKLKNELGKMRKRSRPIVIRYHNVSKLKNPEEHYLIKLQLYLPWRREDEFKSKTLSCQEIYMENYEEISRNLGKHEQLEPIDYDDLENFPEFDDSDSEIDNEEYGSVNPELIDFNITTEESDRVQPFSTSNVERMLLPNYRFYEMCSQLNDKQRKLFIFFTRYVAECKYAQINDKSEPEPFYIFLSGGAGVGKSFLINALTEFAKRVLKYPGQNPEEQPSIAITASTGKAASHINGTTLHAAFKLQINRNNQANAKFKPPSNEALQKLRNRYQYLKILISDEISMTGEKTLNEYLNLTLQLIKGNKLPFGGVSIIASGDFLQLPPVMDRSVFQVPKHIDYNLLLGNLWTQLFKLHELTEIVRQNTDLEFAEMLNRIREGEHTDNDIEKIYGLSKTDISSWPEGFVKVYLTNYMSNKDNEVSLTALRKTIFCINSKDSARDMHTQVLTMCLSHLDDIHKTGNLHSQLKICEGARVMLTYNMDLKDNLINGSTGTVVHMQMPRASDPLHGIIYVKFDDPEAGKSYKKLHFAREELRHCVPIMAAVKTFPYCYKNRTITVQRKQFPLKLAFAITVHNSQGSTLEYMRVDFNRTSKTGKPNSVPVNQGAAYTALSRAKSRARLQLLNFDQEHIKVNVAALNEMKRMREEAEFSWKHPISEGTCDKMVLLNLRSWDAHIEQFITDTEVTNNCDIMCFTETHTQENCYTKISEYLEGWKDIHACTQHGLALCFKEKQVNIMEQILVPPTIEALSVLLNFKGEDTLIVLLYRPPGPVQSFVTDLMEHLEETLSIVSVVRILILGDFNLDQMLEENMNRIYPLLQRFNLHQRSHYSTHIQGGILDLVFDSKKSESVSWILSPYSDHFTLCIQL